MERLRDMFGREASAILLVLLFVQGMAAAFVHFEIVSHFYCPEHDRVTHDPSHAAGEQQPAEGADFPAPDRDREDDHACEWLTWLQNSSVAAPALHATVLELPDPEIPRSPGIHPDRRRAVSVVPLEHVSPINSPPRV